MNRYHSGMESRFLDHFRLPENTGLPADADGTGQAGEPGCGAVIRIGIRFDGDRLGAAGFLASGSPVAIATASTLTAGASGMTWRQAAAITPAALRQETGEGGDAAIAARAAEFAIEALHLALEDSMRRGRFPAAGSIDNDTIMVAMSGGVDSSTACLLLHRQGHEVIGLTMRLWPQDHAASGPSCCSPEAIIEARAVCHSLGLPHLTIDFIDQFASGVVDDFISGYRAGQTPNPCVYCNGQFRFPALAALADRLGAGRVATGHYARVTEEDGQYLLSRGEDKRKDQSYMLAGVDPAMLPRLLLPLGKMEKSQTREAAREAGLAAHARRESQDICFIPEGDYREFFRRWAEDAAGEGDIVNTAGEKLGTHKGYHEYTVGQRRGLGLSADQPLYVLKTEPETNRVIVGSHEELAVRHLTVAAVRQLLPAATGQTFQVQVRYNSPPVSGRVTERGQDCWRLELDKPVYGVAPGQSAVLYRGGAVVASGVIEITAA